MLMPWKRTGSNTYPNTTYAVITMMPARSRVARGWRPRRMLMSCRPSGLLGRLQMRVFRAEGLQPDCRKAHDQFGVAVERLDANHVADTELRVANPHARAQRHARGLSFVLVRVR